MTMNFRKSVGILLVLAGLSIFLFWGNIISLFPKFRTVFDDLRNHKEILLPVPLSIQKLSQRGFNQSWEIAKRIDCRKYIQKSPYILQRHHYSEHQAGSSIENRHQSIRGMFYIQEKYIEKIQHKTVIVFDDVMTSGATLNEIARVLKDNGVSRVINWVLLRATRPIERVQHV